jgi:hypothetical protein
MATRPNLEQKQVHHRLSSCYCAWCNLYDHALLSALFFLLGLPSLDSPARDMRVPFLHTRSTHLQFLRDTCTGTQFPVEFCDRQEGHDTYPRNCVLTPKARSPPLLSNTCSTVNRLGKELVGFDTQYVKQKRAMGA